MDSAGNGDRRSAVLRRLAVILVPTSIAITLLNLAIRVGNAGDHRAQVLVAVSVIVVLAVLAILLLLSVAGRLIVRGERLARVLHPDAVIFTAICSVVASVHFDQLAPITYSPIDFGRWRGNLTTAVTGERIYFYRGARRLELCCSIDLRNCTGIEAGWSMVTAFRNPASLLLTFTVKGHPVELPLPVAAVHAFGIADNAHAAAVRRLAAELEGRLPQGQAR